MGFGVTLWSAHEVNDRLGWIPRSHLDCLTTDDWAPSELVYQDGESCFSERLCDDAAATSDLLFNGSICPMQWQWRRLTLVDGRDALIRRGWSTAPCEGGDVGGMQELQTWVQDAEDARHAFGSHIVWVDPAGIPEGGWSLAVSQTLDGSAIAWEATLAAPERCNL